MPSPKKEHISDIPAVCWKNLLSIRVRSHTTQYHSAFIAPIYQYIVPGEPGAEVTSKPNKCLQHSTFSFHRHRPRLRFLPLCFEFLPGISRPRLQAVFFHDLFEQPPRLCHSPYRIESSITPSNLWSEWFKFKLSLRSTWYWLVHRDPCIGLLQCPYKWIV